MTLKPDLSDQDELRRQVWGALPMWSHSPEACSVDNPCKLCKRSVDEIMSAIALHITEARIDELRRLHVKADSTEVTTEVGTVVKIVTQYQIEDRLAQLNQVTKTKGEEDA